MITAWHKTLMIRWALIATMGVALFWGVWFLMHGSVPETTEFTIFSVRYTYKLPFAFSRWWDILLAGPWMTMIILISLIAFRVLGYPGKRKKSFPLPTDGLRAGLYIGLMFAVATGIATAMEYNLAYSLVYLLVYGLIAAAVFPLFFAVTGLLVSLLAILAGLLLKPILNHRFWHKAGWWLIAKKPPSSNPPPTSP